MNVVEAARIRVKNAFDTGLPIRLGMSGGKDSICVASVVYNLIQEGAVDPKQLTVHFIDEELVYDDVESTVMHWRQKFLLAGAKFEWYCLQFKHFNAMDQLQDNENFIIWDRYEEENWVRKKPDFAITSHPLMIERGEPYHSFLDKISRGTIRLIGIRTAESAMRHQNMANVLSNPDNSGGLNALDILYPIYDWTDNDVWLYILNENLEFPKTYMDLYQIGVPRKRMRLSQFLSRDTARNLVKLNEHQPDLMNRITKRVPNAYLAALYFDTEMFGRKKERDDNYEHLKNVKIDYKKETLKLLSDIPKYFETVMEQQNAIKMKKTVIQYSAIMTEGDWKGVFQILKAGDVMSRSARGLVMNMLRKYGDRSFGKKGKEK